MKGEFMLDKENFEFIKSIDDNYKKATMLANLLFEHKKDKGGFPYLGHLKYGNCNKLIKNSLNKLDSKYSDLGRYVRIEDYL